LPWKKVRGFHLDEYVGLDENHPASFRHFLRERLTRRVDMGAFFEMNGTAQDLEAVCREYMKEMHVAEPQLDHPHRLQSTEADCLGAGPA
jgi:glucosamine-6-phosphate deaminase